MYHFVCSYDSCRVVITRNKSIMQLLFAAKTNLHFLVDIVNDQLALPNHMVLAT